MELQGVDTEIFSKRDGWSIMKEVTRKSLKVRYRG